MSSYNGLNNTTFPEAIQTFKTWADLSASDATNYANYVTAIKNQQTDDAKNALAAMGNNKIVTAIDFNTICDTLVALQQFYDVPTSGHSSIINTLLGQLTFRQAWSSATEYKKFNLVSYSASTTGSALYLCLQDNTNKNPGTETAYWAKVSTAGIVNANTTWKGAWSNGTNASIGDMYSYNNAWWLCTANTSTAPSAGAAWTSVIDFTAYNPIVSSSQPADQANGGLWFHVLT